MSWEQAQLEELRLKAQAFDRILDRYRRLQENAEFYSKNWVELGELIETEQRRLEWWREQS